MAVSRIFNLRGKTYKYEENLNAGDVTSTKTLSILQKNNEGKDVFTPIVKKSKYSQNAYSYENLKTGEVILADNFRSSKVFDVMQRFSKNIWENQFIGTIEGEKITAEHGTERAFRALKKIKAMIKSF